MRTIPLLFVLFSAAWLATPALAYDFQSPEAKQLFIKAASIPAEDYQAILKGERGKVSSFGSHTFTVLILSYKPGWRRLDSEATDQELRFINDELLNPDDLFKALELKDGSASILQEKTIKKVTAVEENGQATGSIEYEIAYLRGKVNFHARQVKDQWVIDRYSMPAHEVETFLTDNGTWAIRHFPKVDVAIYGATPSGILAAIAVKREGKTVVIIEPSRWVGGILGAGLKPMQDCPNYNATGGLTRTLIKTLGQKGERLTANAGSLNPAAIRQDFFNLLGKHQIEVIFEHRVSKVEKKGNTIASATFDNAPFDELGCPPVEPKIRDTLQVTAKVFIDASYEGDFLPRAGISYRVGREAASEFDEPHAGVQPPMELAPIDPFVVPGKRVSGLLKWVENDHGKPVGAADGYTQAYNYRYYTTSDAKHRLPITPPADYKAADFELVGRYVEHLVKNIDDQNKLRQRLVGICPGWLNSGEWNYQRASLFSLAPLGISQKYADGDHAEQARVWKQHQDYLRGLFTFMRTDERVPQWYRDELAEVGLDGRAHPDTAGWPHQLYIRVARRLKGQYTVTAHDVYNKTKVEDPICLAQYGIDTYPSRRIWFEQDGKVQVGIEGKMFVGGSRGPTNVPYPISYRAITPMKEECENLLVPVCFSATHLGYASARMEPVFMICGESAGIAACHAISEKTSVQEIQMAAYNQALVNAGQKLYWDPEKDQSTANDSDGKLTFQNLLKGADTDQNGTISQKEWTAAKSSHAWLFEFIDNNKDAQIDRAEYDAFQKYKDEHPDWMKMREKVKQ